MKIGRRGQAVVEFALILPVIILLICGIIEFGLFFNSYINITFASKEGARVAALDTEATNQTITTAVLAAMPTGKTPTVTVSPSAPRVTGLPVTVTVTMNHTFIIPVISSLMPSNPYPLTSSTTARSE